jgi:hypothetical protein
MVSRLRRTTTVSTETKHCMNCYTPLHISQPGTYREVNHGWVAVRRAGGANAIQMADYSGNVLCGECFGTVSEGEQLPLFDT